MAITAGSIQNVEVEMKEAYPTGTFPDAVNKEAKFRASLNRVDLKMGPEGIARFPLRFAAAQNIGAIDDFDAYPTTGDPTRIQGYCRPEQFVGTFSIGGKAKVLAASGKSTYNEGGIQADRVEGTVADLAKYINIVYAGTNRGRIGIVASDGVNTLVMAQPLGVRLAKVRMPIDVYTALTGGSVRDSLSARRITSRTPSSVTLGYSGADQTAVAGDSMFVAGTYARLFYTLPDIVDDGTNADTMFGVASLRTNYPDSKAQVIANGGTLRNPDEQTILQGVDQAEDESGKRITRIVSGPGIARKVLEFVVADRRFLGQASGSGDPSYTIGYGKNSINIATPSGNLAWETERDCPPRSAFGLAMDTFGLYVASDMDWLTDEGGGMLHLVPTTDGYKHGFVAQVGSLENMFNTMPKANVRWDDWKDTNAGDA